MNKFKVYLATVVFCIALFSSEAMSCPVTKGTISKQTPVSKAENADLLTEEFSFLIQDFKIDHQSENNNLNIKVRFCYENGISDSEYPDFRAILNDIEDFLTNYPNEVDYWEIVNKKLTLMVLKKYPMLSVITSEIQVSPSRLTAYTRSSITTRLRSKTVKTPDKKAR